MNVPGWKLMMDVVALAAPVEKQSTHIMSQMTVHSPISIILESRLVFSF